MSKQVAFGRGTTINAARFCAMLGWTRPTFAGWVAEGLPVKHIPDNKGGEYRIHAGEALEWLFDYAAQGRRPRASGPAREPEGPPLGPGMEMLEGVRDPVVIAFALGALTLIYDLPRLTAVFAVEVGVPIGKAFELSGVMALAALEHVRLRAGAEGLEPWASGEDRVVVNTGAFTPVNWPNLARKAREADWEPPRPMPAWLELSAEEQAACVRYGEEEEARHAAELAAKEAGTA